MPGDCGAGGVYADGSTTAKPSSRMRPMASGATRSRFRLVVDQHWRRRVVLDLLPIERRVRRRRSVRRRPGNGQAFVANEVNGAWGNVMEIPGSSSLFSEGIGTNPLAISCGTPNNCSAGGVYFDSSGNSQASSSTKPQGSGATPLKFPARRIEYGRWRVHVINLVQLGQQLRRRWLVLDGHPRVPSLHVDHGAALRHPSSVRLTSVHGVAGVPLKLTTSGGSGAGKLRFSAEDGPCEVCVVTGDVLRATNRGFVS